MIYHGTQKLGSVIYPVTLKLGNVIYPVTLKLGNMIVTQDKSLYVKFPATEEASGISVENMFKRHMILNLKCF